MNMPKVGVQLAYPLHDPRAGAVVLAAAVRLFGPTDHVRFFITPAGEAPTAEDIQAFSALYAELSDGYAGTAPMQLALPSDVPDDQVALRLTITGNPAADSEVVLQLGELARSLGSAQIPGDASGAWLRGETALARTGAAAAQWRRDRRAGAVARRVRIALLIRHIHYWGALESIALAAQAHPDAEMYLVRLDHRAPTSNHPSDEEFGDFCRARGITVCDENWLRVNLPHLDVAVLPDGYDGSGNIGVGVADLTAAGVRVVLSPYAQALSSEPGNARWLYDLPVHHLAWRIFAASRGQVRNFDRFCSSGSGHVRHVGSVKRERLLTTSAATDDATRIRRTLGTPRTVLWNPHFPSDDGLCTFSKYLQPLLDWFGAHRKVGLIVRPHPRLLDDLERSGDEGVRIAGSIRQRFATEPNIYLDESPDAAAAMHAADAMISDLSSLIPEYLVLNRPTALLQLDGELPLNEDAGVLDGVPRINEVRTLQRFLAEPTARGGHVAELDDLATGERIVQSIIDELRLELALGQPVGALLPAAEPRAESALV